MLPVLASADRDGGPGLDVAIGGLQTCGAWWCPRCGPKVTAERAREDAHALQVWHALGNSATLGTFTARHNAGTRLEPLIRAMRAAWSKMWKGRSGMRLRRELGIRYRVRVLEVNLGDQHGWHPHFHVLFFHDGPQRWGSGETARAAFRAVWAEWVRHLRAQGFDAVEEVLGQAAGFDVQPVDLGNGDALERLVAYLNKGAGVPERVRAAAEAEAMGPALELDGGAFKRGGRPDAPKGQRHRSIAQVFEDHAIAMGTGAEMDDAARVSEFLVTARRMRLRQRDPSPKMRAELAAEAERLGLEGPLLEDYREDEEIAAEDAPADSVIVGWIPARAWSAYLAWERDDMRAVARVGGLAALVEWFDRRGVGFEWARSVEVGAHGGAGGAGSGAGGGPGGPPGGDRRAA